jgi:hypothetical protein
VDGPSPKRNQRAEHRGARLSDCLGPACDLACEQTLDVPWRVSCLEKHGDNTTKSWNTSTWACDHALGMLEGNYGGPTGMDDEEPGGVPVDACLAERRAKRRANPGLCCRPGGGAEHRPPPGRMGVRMRCLSAPAAPRTGMRRGGRGMYFKKESNVTSIDSRRTQRRLKKDWLGSSSRLARQLLKAPGSAALKAGSAVLKAGSAAALGAGSAALKTGSAAPQGWLGSSPGLARSSSRWLGAPQAGSFSGLAR